MTIIEDDYTEADRWDWDQSDDSQYCQHGKFIGSWWGPDILCGWCEDGISAKEMREILQAQRDAKVRKALEAEVNVAEALPFNGTHLHWYVHWFAPWMIERNGITEADIERWGT